jgi:hypothetical protein
MMGMMGMMGMVGPHRFQAGRPDIIKRKDRGWHRRA